MRVLKLLQDFKKSKKIDIFWTNAKEEGGWHLRCQCKKFSHVTDVWFFYEIMAYF
jgi:hypothetical protein